MGFVSCLGQIAHSTVAGDDVTRLQAVYGFEGGQPVRGVAEGQPSFLTDKHPR